MLNEEQQTIAVVKKATPAVISIEVNKDLPHIEGVSSGHQMLSPHLLPPLTPERENLLLEELPPEKIRISGGSGFIVDPNGLIITNKHVVIDPQAEYLVTTFDEKSYPAKVLSRDPLNDVAILKIEAQNLPVLPLASASPEPGQTVLAIGNALGLFSHTVSKGIISGLAREISAALEGGADGSLPQIEKLRGVIQTDVAINQGNSGGPLLNLKGEVVGINTAVIYGAQNIGFAIPIDWARHDLEDLRRYGRIVRPYIGLRYVMLSKELQKRYRLPVDYGALIAPDLHFPGNQAIVKNSPAEKAGLRENDIITEVNGQKLDTKKDLSDFIQLLKVGEKIELTFLRNRKALKARMVLEERKAV